MRILAVWCVVAGWAGAALAAPMDGATQRHVRVAASYLAQQVGGQGPAKPRGLHAAVSLAAFLSAGITPDDPGLGRSVAGCIEATLGSAQPDGWMGEPNTRMYGHAVCVYALAQSVGVDADMGRRRRTLEALGRGVEVLVAAQVSGPGPHAGGWRYGRDSKDADASVTAWVVLALVSARRAGVEVPDATLAGARGYLAGLSRGEGAYAYSATDRPMESTSSAAAAAMALIDAAARDSGKVPATKAATRPAAAATKLDGRYPYSAMFHALHAQMLGVGNAADTPAAIHAALMRRRREDGSFGESGAEVDGSRVYATAMAVMILSMPSSPTRLGE